MRLTELFQKFETDILNEVQVQSSWIEDIELDYDDGDVIMTLLSGRAYRIENFPEDLYELWIEADSPGKFWHNYVAGMYNTTRIF
jgi:hypothetical protein